MFCCSAFLSVPDRFAVEEVALAYVGRHVVPATVRNGDARGRHLPSSYGRDAGDAYARVSFKPERAFNVIAHVRDWEHAETVRRRCLRTVGGFVLEVECTG